MTRNKRKKRELHPETIANRIARAREVRDIYNHLRKKYNAVVLDNFFQQHYFLRPRTIEQILLTVDREPVSNPSITYQNVMKPDFFL
jgi:hypothetical protein